MTATTLKKYGLKPRRGAKAFGLKVGGYGPYALHAVAECEPLRRAPAQQRAAAAAGSFLRRVRDDYEAAIKYDKTNWTWRARVARRQWEHRG